MILGDKALTLSACCLAAVAVACFVPSPRSVCAQQADVEPGQSDNDKKAEEADDIDLQFFRPALNTSIMAESILRTARELTEAGAYYEASEHYVDAVTRHPRAIDKVSDAYYLPLWRIVLGEIAAWPPEGIAAYREVVGDDARRLFDDAVRNRDLRHLEQIAQQYFLSSVGDNAAVIVADRCREAGWSALALFYYTLVLDKYPDSDIPRQDILIRAALAARGADLGNRYATLAGQIDAGAVRPDATGKAVAATDWLAGQSSQEIPPDAAGDGRGNRSAAPVVVPATVTWQIKLTQQWPTNNRRRFYNPSGTTSTPPIYPTLAGHRVYMANLHSAWALDARDGRRLWRYDTREADGEKLPGIGQSQARQPLVVGNTVYVPLEQPPPKEPVQRNIYARRGLSASTDLYALRADTGEPLWHWSPRGGEMEFGSLSVDGQPVASGDLIFVALASPNMFFGEIHTAAINRHTGRLVWAQPMAAFMTNFTGGTRGWMNQGNIVGTAMTARQGLLLSTGIGITTAQSCLGGGILWTRIMPDMPQPKMPKRGARTTATPSTTEGICLARRPRALAARGMVVSGFAMSPHLWAYDWLDGRIVWKQPAEGARQPLAIVGDTVVAWGRTVRAFDLRTGKPLRSNATWSEPIVGEPVVAGDRVLAPTQSAIIIVNLSTGTIEQTCALPSDVASGNLVLGESGLIIVSATGAACMHDWLTARRQFLAMADKNPENPSPLVALGATALRLRKVEEGLAHLDRAMTRNPTAEQQARIYKLFEDFYRQARQKQNRTQMARLLDRLETSATDGANNCRQAFLRADFLVATSPRKAIAALQNILDDPPSRHVRVTKLAGPGVSGILAEETIGRLITLHGRRLYDPWERKASVARRQARAAGDYDGLLEVAMRYPNSRAARGALDDAVGLLVRRADATEANRLLIRLVNMTPPGHRRQRYRALLVDTSLKLGSVGYAAMVASALAETSPGETTVPRADGSRTTVAALTREAEAARDARVKRTASDDWQLPKPPLRKVWQSNPDQHLGRFSAVNVAKPRDEGAGDPTRPDILLLYNRQKVLAVDRSNGNIRWSQNLPAKGRGYRHMSQCALGSHGLYVIGKGDLKRLDPTSGKQTWHIKLQPEHRREIFAPRESVTGTLHYGDTGWITGSNLVVNRIQEMDDKVIASAQFNMYLIDPRDGYTIETVAYPKGVYPGGFIRYGHRTISIPRSPNSMKNRVLVHNLATGNLDREIRFSANLIPSGITPHGSRWWPLFSTNGDKMWVVDMAGMTVSPPIAVNVGMQRSGRVNNRMGLADAGIMLVAGLNNPVRGLDVRTGKERWTFAPEKKITARLTPAHDGHVLVSWNRSLAVLRTADGHVLWRRDFGDTVSVSSVRIVGRQMLCLIRKRVQRTNIQTTVLLDHDTGKTVFEFARPGNQIITVIAADRFGYLLRVSVPGRPVGLEYWVHDPKGEWTWPPPEKKDAEEVKEDGDGKTP
jgi:outer membrane protein assembly factor BamB